MEEMKETRKHFSRLALMFLAGTIIIYAVQLLVSNLVNLLRPEWLENPDISLTVSMVPMYLIGMPLLILLVRRIPATVIEHRSMKLWQFLLAIVMCFCVMYCSNFLGIAVTTVIGILKGSMVNNVILDVVSGTSLITNVLYMVICAPIMEEFIFRKLIVDRTVRYGQGTAVLLSGLMFGLFHGNLNQFVYAFSIGMFFAFLYVKTGQIKYTIGIHMIVNFFGSIVSTWMMEAMNYEGYLEAVSAGAGMDELMQLVMDYLPGWIAYMVYLCMIMTMVIAGIVLFIVFRKRFALTAGEVQLPKGSRFKNVFLNVGMLLYCAFWIAEIVLQLFDNSFILMIYSLFR